jgi:hypothetical protein
MHDRHADQAENAYTDPLGRGVEQVSPDCHAHDEYDVPNDVYSERHGGHLSELSLHRTSNGPGRSVRKHTLELE